MNPTDLAAERHRPYRQVVANVSAAEQVLAGACAQAVKLEGQLAEVEREDEARLGQALVAGKEEPAPEAPRLQAELEAARRRIKAVERQIDAARAQVDEVIAAHRSEWHRESIRQTSKATVRYQDAVDELVKAREQLSAEVALGAFVLSGGQPAADPAFDALAGRTAIVGGRPPLSFGVVLAELRNDIAHLGEWVATRHDPPPTVRLEQVRRAFQQ